MAEDRARVEVHQEGSERWVTIRNSWRNHFDPAELEAEIVQLVNQDPDTPSLSQVPVGHLEALSYEQLIEFGRLRREFQAQRRSQLDHLNTQVQQMSHATIRGASAAWRSGRLVRIHFERDLLDRATAQELSDTVTELLNAGPEADEWEEPPGMKRARERIDEFWSTV